jgi:uncharacterized protein (DUF433 family)
MSRKILGKYIVADSDICNGKPIFVGTHIMVAQVLQMLAKGKDWDAISNEFDGKVSKRAIAEATNLAARVFGPGVFS